MRKLVREHCIKSSFSAAADLLTRTLMLLALVATTMMVGAQTTKADSSSITSLVTKRWVTNRNLDSYLGLQAIAVNENTPGITDDYGISVTALTDPEYKRNPGSANAETYSFWKAALQGGSYGQAQTDNTGDDQTMSGTEIERVRWRNGGLQWMGEEGNWKNFDATQNPTLSLYYRQSVYLKEGDAGSAKDAARLQLSDWYTSDWGSYSNQNKKAFMISVYEENEGQSPRLIWISKPMYYYNDSAGVKHAGVDITRELLRNGYDIVDAALYVPQTKYNSMWWSEYFDTYKYNFIREGNRIGDLKTRSSAMDFSIDWKNGEHQILHVTVRRTGQTNLRKVMAAGAENMGNQEFTFEAIAKLDNRQNSLYWRDGYTWYQEYPIDGTSDGQQYVNARTFEGPDPDNNGQMTTFVSLGPFKVRPGSTVSIKGLPTDAVVRYQEIGSGTNDPSAFEVQQRYTFFSGKYSSDPHEQASPGNGGAAVFTNTPSKGDGKLLITKRFSNLDQLTDRERWTIQNTFRISEEGDEAGRVSGQLPVLTLNNASTKGDILNAQSETEYTWELNKLSTGDPITLVESGYTSGAMDVVSSTFVAQNDGIFSPRASVQVSNVTQTVVFDNYYRPRRADVIVTKQWKDVEEDQKGTVKAKLWAVSSENKSKRALVTDQIVLNANGGWIFDAGQLPLHTPELGDIEYVVEETSVGDVPFSQTKLRATQTTTKQVTANSGTVQVNVTNSGVTTATIKIHSFFEGPNKSQLPLVGSVYRIVAEEGVEAPQLPVKLLVGEDGYTMELSGLHPGKYKVEESSVPKGFSTHSNLEFVVGDDGGVTFFGELITPGADGVYTLPVSHLAVAPVRIFKHALIVGATPPNNVGKALPGATFKFVALDVGNTVLTQERSTGMDGMTQQENLTPGEYMVYETKAPAGYGMMDYEVRVRVNAPSAYNQQPSVEVLEIRDGKAGTWSTLNPQNRLWTIKIGDAEIGTLPQTGKSGHLVMAVVGSTLVLGSLVYAFKRLRGARDGEVLCIRLREDGNLGSAVTRVLLL